MQIENNEIILDDSAFLVSETDEKGLIKFANDDFCKYAGYTLKELIGKQHNIVRHPDMPKAAFKDLWQTSKDGKRWNGFVKNTSRSVHTIQNYENTGKINEHFKTNLYQKQTTIKCYDSHHHYHRHGNTDNPRKQ